ncbi:MAG: hypothetical protein EPO13_02035 [Actinomycetota bacterium]|nr:MAG: hypothetical protein EPO13_02035 [Actinomycetota bacterium]
MQAADEAAAQDALQEHGLTDGLPVVVPTPARVEQLIQAGGLDAEFVLGEIGPRLGVATIEKVAINAVMAGCLPEHFPVVIAAVRAVTRPEFDLTELQATTHNVAPLIIVNGPARIDCGPIASGVGALGAGFRANATIGRALRLCLLNLGGARPGVGDMAIMGQPGKFSYCLAEAEEHSPFPPLHTTRGCAAEDSAVTVVGAEAPHSVLVAIGTTHSDLPFADRWLRTVSAALASPASNNSQHEAGTVTVVLNPAHAQPMAEAGYTREQLQAELFSRTWRTAEELAYYTGATYPPGSRFNVVKEPADILLLVAGDSGNYTYLMPSAGPLGSHFNRPVTQRLVDQTCELPAPSV